MPGSEVECFAGRTEIAITFGVVGEVLNAKEFGTMIVIGKGNVGTDMLVFDSHDILFLPYLLSPVACLGHTFQRKRARHSKSSIGLFSETSEGATSRPRMILALPPSTT